MLSEPIAPVLPDIAASVRLITRSLPQVPARPGCRVLVLDLAGANVPTAAGLGELVSLHKRLRASGGHLVLCNVQERAYQVFEVTRLADFLEVRRAEANR